MKKFSHMSLGKTSHAKLGTDEDNLFEDEETEDLVNSKVPINYEEEKITGDLSCFKNMTKLSLSSSNSSANKSSFLKRT